eukprot:TRINITY_DN18671_c0_g1_i2.p1 TRINITY_DN18671_c0_g1~~TRINITY_DN18671_c0_g1_i2.p1  ORF type:complete len:324 (+),score=88.01 TRINITY_DN18671_c0_g1_i2:63-1034(+)
MASPSGERSAPTHRELMESDGFTVVEKKGSSRGGYTGVSAKHRKRSAAAAAQAGSSLGAAAAPTVDSGAGGASWTPQELETLVAKVEARREEVAASGFWAELQERLASLPGLRARETAADGDAAVAGTSTAAGADGEWHLVEELVLYGHGSPDDSIAAQCQLALALLLHSWLQLRRPLLAFDPAMSALDRAALQRLGVQVIATNEQGLRPHCDLQLYSNLLWANWLSPEQLQRVIVIGNSFTAYSEGLGADAARRSACLRSTVAALLPLVDEQVIRGSFDRVGVFNNTSLHHFRHPDGRLRRASPELWHSDRRPPVPPELDHH